MDPGAIHDAIRRVKGSYDFIESGITAVRKLRPHMWIIGRTTVQKMNHSHLFETVRSARAMGLNGISFLAVDTTSEAFNRPLLWPGERQMQVALALEEVDVLEREIEDMIAWCDEATNRGYVAEDPEKLRRIVSHFRAYLGQTHFRAPRCNAPWVSAVIEADGAVRPCPASFIAALEILSTIPCRKSSTARPLSYSEANWRSPAILLAKDAFVH